MLKNKTWLILGYRILIAITVPFALSTILGCGGGGENSPLPSSLSTTPSAEAGSASREADSPSSDVASLPDELHAGDAEAPEDALALTPDASLTAGSAEEPAADSPPPQAPTGTPLVALNSTPSGATAEVTWQPSTDSNVNGYYIYYGKQSSGEPGVCSYEERYSVESPSVTITELEPNTPYFFAVSSYSSHESPCSNETAIITPPARA
ncbi:fibronectin type III domain-containing protein [Candidatus Nitrospira nitrosa]|uniref:fibronectin type III domain-containing protein n=1 Tax=Candidatus Nitrospira nitrosa TaxID=1742972 RepID=UPI000A5E6007